MGGWVRIDCVSIQFFCYLGLEFILKQHQMDGINVFGQQISLCSKDPLNWNIIELVVWRDWPDDILEALYGLCCDDCKRFLEVFSNLGEMNLMNTDSSVWIFQGLKAW